MCDICQVARPDELKREYVLVQHTMEYHVTYSVIQKTEIGRVSASVCENCYQESCHPAESSPGKEQNIWVSFTRWWNKKLYFSTKEELVAELGRKKLGMLYPLEVSKIGMTNGKYPLYFIHPAEM